MTTVQKINCHICMKGFCDDCINPKTCLCASINHNQKSTSITELFTQRMSELLPTCDEFKTMLRNSPKQQLTLFEKPIEDIKPNRWITVSEQQEFYDFLCSVGITFEKLDWCATDFEKFKCTVNDSHVRKVRYIPCGCRGKCPRCSMSYASKRANISYQWIKQNLADRLDFDLKLNQIVLTLPELLHDIDTKLFAKMIKKFMKSFEIGAYGYCIQTRHSKDPLSERYVHAHVLSLNMKENDNIIFQSDYYFDVERMRQVWKDIIEKNTNIKVEGDVNLHTEYASILHDKNKVLHMFAYLYRYPIQDLFNVQIRTQSINYVQPLQFEKLNGPSERDLIREKVMNLIDEDKPRLVWCGLLTSTKRKKLVKKIIHVGPTETLDGTITILQIDNNELPGFHWKSMKEIEKEMDERAKCCRDCGSPYEKEPYESGKYTGDNEPDVN